METTIFSERLKSIMDETDMRQTELCEKAGIGRSAMCQYLHGAFMPKQQKLRAIAEALNVSESWLMGYDLDDGTLQIHGVVERVEIKF